MRGLSRPLKRTPTLRKTLADGIKHLEERPSPCKALEDDRGVVWWLVGKHLFKRTATKYFHLAKPDKHMLKRRCKVKKIRLPFDLTLYAHGYDGVPTLGYFHKQLRRKDCTLRIDGSGEMLLEWNGITITFDRDTEPLDAARNLFTLVDHLRDEELCSFGFKVDGI
jgi:hypothetical protein